MNNIESHLHFSQIQTLVPGIKLPLHPVEKRKYPHHAISNIFCLHYVILTLVVTCTG